ncbi:MAG: ComEC/Rec2 family competence protein [Chloroflexi bacterium]|nr:ComEC/Rec2 family competence protein [Chloroflexota bacterium]
MKLLCAAIAFVGGTLVGAPPEALALFAAAGIVGAVLLARLRVSVLPAVMVLAFALGGARVAVGDDAPLTAYAGPRVQQVEGIVVSDVDGYGDFSRFRLRVERVHADGADGGNGANSVNSANWTDAIGTLLVSARADAEIAKQRNAPYFRYGDRLLLRGRISEPPQLDDFDYAAYLARQGISEVMDARSVTIIGTGEGSAFYRSLYDVRRRLAQSIAAVVPEPQAALSQATLLGLRRSMPSDLTEAFRRSGSAHLLAISGMHVGILLSVSLSAGAAIFGKKWHLHLIAPLLVIWLYGLLAGMSPSATRACIMGSVYLAALAFGRQRGALAPIGFAAALMVAVSPSVLYSISFQLSFAAIAGIAAFSGALGEAIWSQMARLTARLPGRLLHWRSPLRAPVVALTDLLGASIAATIASLPLIALHFERVSTMGIPASVLTLPALPLLIMSSAGAAITGLASTTLAMSFGWLAWGAGAYLSGVVTMLSGLPGVSVEIGNVPAWAVAVYYGALALAYGVFAMFPWQARSLWQRMNGVQTTGGNDAAASENGNRDAAARTTGEHGSAKEAVSQDESSGVSSPRAGGSARKFAHIAVWLLVPAAFVASLAWSQALSRDDLLRVAFLDVGQGDAIFIETPRGRQVLVDGGTDGLVLARLLGERMRFNDKHLDMVVATHPHTDHIGGLTLALERYDVGAILERRIEYESAAYEAWSRAVSDEQSQGATVVQARAGQVIALDENTRLEVIWPMDELLHGTTSDADNASVALRLVHGDVSVLLTGDIFAEAERALLASGAALDSDALKVPHHGSDSSSTPEFLSAVSPAVAVVSVGADNRFGHPDASVVERLREFVGEDGLYLTVEQGTMELISDGTRLWVKAER